MYFVKVLQFAIFYNCDLLMYVNVLNMRRLVFWNASFSTYHKFHLLLISSFLVLHTKCRIFCVCARYEHWAHPPEALEKFQKYKFILRIEQKTGNYSWGITVGKPLATVGWSPDGTKHRNGLCYYGTIPIETANHPRISRISTKVQPNLQMTPVQLPGYRFNFFLR